MNRPRRRWLAIGAAALVAFHTLLAYGLPPLVPIAGTAALLALFWFIGPANAWLVSGTLVVTTLVYATALHFLDWESRVYRTPAERLSVYDVERDHRVYRASARVEMRIPFGDLQSMTQAPIGIAHDVSFVTDSLGWRNDLDYQGQPYLLVGDSFVAGMNNTQRDLLAVALTEHGHPAYTLAHPGEVDDYLRYIEGFRRGQPDAGRVLLFLFEGNDLASGGERWQIKEKRPVPAWVRDAYKSWFGMFSGTGVYRFTSSLYKRARNMRRQERSDAVELRELAGRTVAFYRPYVEVTREPRFEATPELEQQLELLAPLVDHVFLIPTKFRVHHEVFTADGEPLPRARWRYLSEACARHSLACTDLTDSLVEAGRAAAERGEFVWWPDDTHWNGRGAAAAAAAVAQVLDRERSALPAR